MNIGLFGGIIGSVLGVAGGMIGAYFSYRSANGPREQRLVILGSIACFAYVGLFLAVLFLFPQTRPGIFVPYVIILIASIGYWNRRLTAIRREEQKP